jgi:hypothetical protein
VHAVHFRDVYQTRQTTVNISSSQVAVRKEAKQITAIDDTRGWVFTKCWEEDGVTAFEHLSVYNFLGNCSINLCEQQRPREELADGAEPPWFHIGCNLRWA